MSGGADTYSETLDSKAAGIESYLETYAPEETAVTYVEDTEKTYDFEGHNFVFLNSNDIYYMNQLCSIAVSPSVFQIQTPISKEQVSSSIFLHTSHIEAFSRDIMISTLL